MQNLITYLPLIPLLGGIITFFTSRTKVQCRIFTVTTLITVLVSALLTSSEFGVRSSELVATPSSEFGARSSELSDDADIVSAPINDGQKKDSELRTPNSELSNIDLQSILLFITPFLFFLISFYLKRYLATDTHTNCSETTMEGRASSRPQSHLSATQNSELRTPYSELKASDKDASSARILIGCLQLFLATMLLVLTAQSFGLLWVAVEATTLASAPLITYHRSTRSLEAMWKYLLICSVGIGFALLGTMCLAISGHLGAGETPADLSFAALQTAIQSGGLHEGWFKAAFIFILAGYGTKMGLAPFHTWLPDAHSESPAAVSALLSGTLLNCAFFAIYRVVTIVEGPLRTFCNELLIFFGLLSLLVSALFIIKQSDYKRMLAYSSVEHMGIIALACGLSATTAINIHVVGHTLLKAMLFLTAGNILAIYGTRQINQVSGLITTTPKNAILWMIGLLLICGTPPSPLFISEYNIILTAVQTGNLPVAILTVILLFAVFAGMSAAVFNMFFCSSEFGARSSELVATPSSEFGARSSELSDDADIVSAPINDGQKKDSELRTPNSELSKNNSELRTPNFKLNTSIACILCSLASLLGIALAIRYILN